MKRISVLLGFCFAAGLMAQGGVESRQVETLKKDFFDAKKNKSAEATEKSPRSNKVRFKDPSARPLTQETMKLLNESCSTETENYDEFKDCYKSGKKKEFDKLDSKEKAIEQKQKEPLRNVGKTPLDKLRLPASDKE